MANTYWNALLDLPNVPGRILNAPLVSQDAIDYYAALPYMDSLPTPTLAEGYWYAVHYIPFVGPAIGAYEQHQEVVTALSYGDEASAVRHAQGAIINTGAAVLSAPPALRAARGAFAETAASMPRVRIEFPRPSQTPTTYAVFTPPPVRVRIQPSVSSNQAFVQRLATYSDRIVSARPQTSTMMPQAIGIEKHTVAMRGLRLYNRLNPTNTRGLTAEVQYRGGAWVSSYNMGPRKQGAVVLDVVEGPLSAPTAIFDYKFGLSTWGTPRITKIRNTLPQAGRAASIYEVTP